MPLDSGSWVGQYEILAPIGAGGMGEVYRARDSKLNRLVAIKVLPSGFAHNEQRLARFEREARVLASLNHPNIAQIYGLEESGPTRALVMELIEGSTLAIPQSSQTAILYAKQIAEALEASHEKGITHRDLKPANIMVTIDGVVKVLDFGIASIPARESMANPGDSPTMTMAATAAGMIMGTAAYMSPEQACGKTVDKRSDIWSFGVILYELLTGTRLFTGATTAHILADVIRGPIDFAKLPPSTPAPVRQLIERCLMRDPKQRLRDIGDVRIFLDDKPLSEPPLPAARAKFGALHWAAIAIPILILLGIGYQMAFRSEEPRPLVSFNLDLDVDAPANYSGVGPEIVLSPDAGRIVYLAEGKLFSRRLDQPEATGLAGTEGAFLPFFSPDGQWVGFFAGSSLKKVSFDGGIPLVLCETQTARGASWGEDGNIVAALHVAAGLSRISASSGSTAPLTSLSAGEQTHRWPQVLPGGKAVLFTSHTDAQGFDSANLEVVSIKDGRRRLLLKQASFGRYLPSGHLIYLNNASLFAVPFDLNSLEVRGSPKLVLNGVAYSPSTGGPQLSASNTGVFLYRGSSAAGIRESTLQYLGSDGNAQILLGKPGFHFNPRFSPDGNLVAVEIADTTSGRDIWIHDRDRDTTMRLTYGAEKAAMQMNPIWTPNGRYVVFAKADGIYWTRSDGVGKASLLLAANADISNVIPFSFKPDGTALFFGKRVQRGQSETLVSWLAPIEIRQSGMIVGKPEAFLPGQFAPMLSPDGKWLASSSFESGLFRLFVRHFPDNGGKWEVSAGVARNPVWSPKTNELFYRSIDDHVMAASYSVNGDAILFQKPHRWTEKIVFDGNNTSISSFDVAPDGKHIAALLPAGGRTTHSNGQPMVLLMNFFDELRRKVPAGDR